MNGLHLLGKQAFFTLGIVQLLSCVIQLRLQFGKIGSCPQLRIIFGNHQQPRERPDAQWDRREVTRSAHDGTGTASRSRTLYTHQVISASVQHPH